MPGQPPVPDIVLGEDGGERTVDVVAVAAAVVVAAAAAHSTGAGPFEEPQAVDRRSTQGQGQQEGRLRAVLQAEHYLLALELRLQKGQQQESIPLNTDTVLETISIPMMTAEGSTTYSLPVFL